MLKIDRRLLLHFEWPLFGLVLLAASAGLLTIFSATYQVGGPRTAYVVRQGIWVVLGLAALVTAALFDYRLLARYAYGIYGLALGLLVLVRVAGTEAGGARRWLGIGPMNFQPSELMKIALVIALARHLHRPAGDSRLPLRWVIGPALLLALPTVLVLRQPDLGTVIVFGLLTASMLLLAGLPPRFILLAVLIAGPAVPFVWRHLKPYQQQRVLSFFDPQADPLGAGYHVRQSQIAIGSGMVTGKGYLRGTQNQLKFLPEQHTDFIFSVYAEEWGFLGSAALLGLYLALVLRGLIIAGRARDHFGALLAAGLTAALFWQVTINIGMATGSLPVVGITLPFLSYGGSSTLAFMTAMGLVMSVGMRRFAF